MIAGSRVIDASDSRQNGQLGPGADGRPRLLKPESQSRWKFG
jgi:hypothetical protein